MHVRSASARADVAWYGEYTPCPVLMQLPLGGIKQRGHHTWTASGSHAGAVARKDRPDKAIRGGSGFVRAVFSGAAWGVERSDTEALPAAGEVAGAAVLSRVGDTPRAARGPRVACGVLRVAAGVTAGALAGWHDGSPRRHDA